MPRLQALLECVGQALCEKGRKALQGQWPFADVLPDVAKTAFDYAHKKLPGDDFRTAVGDCAAVDASEYDRRVGELIAELATTHAVPKAELADYLRVLPVTVRQGLRRPSDPDGRTVPETSRSRRRKGSRRCSRRGFRSFGRATDRRGWTTGP